MYHSLNIQNDRHLKRFKNFAQQQTRPRLGAQNRCVNFRQNRFYRLFANVDTNENVLSLSLLIKRISLRLLIQTVFRDIFRVIGVARHITETEWLKVTTTDYTEDTSAFLSARLHRYYTTDLYPNLLRIKFLVRSSHL